MIPRKIIAIGASDFFGMGDDGKGGYIGRLKQWHEQQSDKNFLYNLSVRGETTAQVTQRLTIESLPRKPQLLLLTAGSNDIRRRGSKANPVKTSDEDFRDNVLSMIRQGKALGDVVFIGTHPLDESRTAPFAYWNKQNFYLIDDQKRREKMVAFLCEQERIPFLDVFHTWLDQNYFQWLHEDGQHANSRGHDIIFNQLKDMLGILYS
jgi:lysophospholipase L1-like esterase